ncbi:hypothetical protein DACRYDRAFT_107331 [Dacryopinax primogenitus]|uniref:Ubiquitin-like protease family profile domain-containing protein n=1 Tax=Dacryopinax primogenitus (strain DJM 731) TaxID=1858805 RepID=M5G965_DACPD|nr:uncharacterized protein DACRYDRAFT_107331 [Dacryopinax primogenitus]EJU02412.1 hypothetical protein DACRYDRAFT_107331 [Dacryopinax primogenitus]
MTMRSGNTDAVNLVIALAHLVNLIIALAHLVNVVITLALALLAVVIPTILALHLLVITIVLGLLVNTIVLALILLVIIAALARLSVLATPPLKAVMNAHLDCTSRHAANKQDDFGATHAHNIIKMEHMAPILLQTPPTLDHLLLLADIDLGPPPQYAEEEQAVVEDVKMGNAKDEDNDTYERRYSTPPPTVPVVKQGWSKLSDYVDPPLPCQVPMSEPPVPMQMPAPETFSPPAPVVELSVANQAAASLEFEKGTAQQLGRGDLWHPQLPYSMGRQKPLPNNKIWITKVFQIEIEKSDIAILAKCYQWLNRFLLSQLCQLFAAWWPNQNCYNDLHSKPDEEMYVFSSQLGPQLQQAEKAYAKGEAYAINNWGMKWVANWVSSAVSEYMTAQVRMQWLFPMHINNNHWILIHVDWLRKFITMYNLLRMASWCDHIVSTQCVVERIWEVAVEKSKPFPGWEGWKGHHAEVLLQTNGSDCSLFIAAHTFAIAQGYTHSTMIMADMVKWHKWLLQHLESLPDAPALKKLRGRSLLLS